MSTNFYWLTVEGQETPTIKLRNGAEVSLTATDMDPRIHIGKRSGAGAYCFDCETTLCADGESGIHHAGRYWFTECPDCGVEPAEEGEPATCVRWVCSFSWAQDPEEVRKTLKENAQIEVVVDEYGVNYTGEAFLETLKSCPINYTNSVGKEFC